MLPLKTLSLTQDNLILNLKHGPPKNDHLNASYALISPLGYMFIYWGNISAK